MLFSQPVDSVNRSFSWLYRTIYTRTLYEYNCMIFDHTRSHFRCILNEMQLCSALTFNAWQVPCDVKRPGIEDESMIVQRLIDKMQQITCSAFFIRGKADERTKRKKKLVGRFLIDFDAVLIPNRLRSPGLYAFYPHLYLLPQKFQPPPTATAPNLTNPNESKPSKSLKSDDDLIYSTNI